MVDRWSERPADLTTCPTVGQFILALLIGALASAEERALGTLQWQTLQPYAAWKQWAIKAATALTLTLLLVVALPAVLSVIGADVVDRFWLGLHVGWQISSLVENGRLWLYVVGLLTLTATALFTSTFTRSSLHALLTGGVAAIIGGVTMTTAFSAATDAVYRAFDLNAFYHVYATSDLRREALRTTWTRADLVWTGRLTLLAVAVGVIGFLVVLLLFGHRNHQSADTPRPVVARQLVSLFAFVIAATLVVGAGRPLLQYFLLTH